MRCYVGDVYSFRVVHALLITEQTALVRGYCWIVFAIELPEYRDFVRNHRGRFINSTI